DRICTETGGRAFYPKNEKDMESAFRQIAEELSSQYILAYYPSTNSQTGFREIDINIPADSRLRVIHRRGYVTDENSSEK
ncbi:MAG: hypothetical protein JNN15_04675, partial [Blastocatellia bacterium]|nr:hypothetical protein [Blastocatellia bacterium]